jgi:hypothetical protein
VASLYREIDKRERRVRLEAFTDLPVRERKEIRRGDFPSRARARARDDLVSSLAERFAVPFEISQYR